MVTTQQVTPTKFIEMYARGGVSEVINVKVGTEQRIYGKTGEEQRNNPDGFIIVYAVVT